MLARPGLMLARPGLMLAGPGLMLAGQLAFIVAALFAGSAI